MVKAYTKEDIKEDIPLIIYGAGRYGELAFFGLKEWGITPSAFVDKNYFGKDYMGIKVIRPDKIQDYSNAQVLIASYNYYNEIKCYLEGLGIEEIYHILNLILIDYDEDCLSEYAKDEKHNVEKYKNVIENENEGLVFNHVELVITEACSLKCKDCANLIQYYSKPKQYSFEELKSGFNRFLEGIDKLLELRILGGEPFLNKDIGRIVNYYSNNKKIIRIAIYTNSTVLPSNEVVKLLSCDKVCVHMSDYGGLSKSLDMLKKTFQKNDISYYVHRYELWHDLGGVKKRDYTEERLSSMYQNCLMSKCYTFFRNKLYICPRAAHGERLGFFKNNNDEVVVFGEGVNREEVREEMLKFVKRPLYINACNYCNGSSNESKKVKSAIQMD